MIINEAALGSMRRQEFPRKNLRRYLIAGPLLRSRQDEVMKRVLKAANDNLSAETEIVDRGCDGRRSYILNPRYSRGLGSLKTP